MKALVISRKIILEYLREPLMLGLIFAFPVLLLGFYAIAFGDTGQGMAKHLKVMVQNLDTGLTQDGTHINIGDQLLEAIKEAQFEGSPIFHVQEITDRSFAEISLREHKAALLLVIPPDFSAKIAIITEDEGQPAILSVDGYPSSDLFVFSKSLLEGTIHDFIEQVTGWRDDRLELNYEFVPGTGTMSDFEFGVPGLIVFGIMFLTISSAMTMVREEVNGTLDRIRLTRMKAKDMILGLTGAQLAVGILLAPFIFGCARLMGFRGNGSLPLAVLISILLTLAAVGLGLITACFARNDGEAANLSSIIGVVMVILSGAMYPMPKAPIATIGGRTIQIYDLLPPAHASEALRKILVYGEGLQDIGYEAAALTTLSIIILIAGIGIYQLMKLNKTI